MNKHTLSALLIFAIGLSCKEKSQQTIDNVQISKYNVQITYSSFFDCGDFQRILIDNKWEEDPVYKSKIRNYHLYTFEITGNCQEQTKIDTLPIEISALQSDNIFKLANLFVNNFNIYDSKSPGIKTVVLDGSDVKVEVCYENKCKEATIYHYGKMPKDLLNLINYIDSIK